MSDALPVRVVRGASVAESCLQADGEQADAACRAHEWHEQRFVRAEASMQVRHLRGSCAHDGDSSGAKRLGQQRRFADGWYPRVRRQVIQTGAGGDLQLSAPGSMLEQDRAGATAQLERARVQQAQGRVSSSAISQEVQQRGHAG